MQPYGCGFGSVFFEPRPFPFATVTAASNRAPKASKAGPGPCHSQFVHIVKERDVGPERGQRPKEQRALALAARVCASAPALAAFTCHSRQSAGIASRWTNFASTAADDFAPHPGSPG